MDDRYAKVESLYGPGTVGAWLCSIFSVFISWTITRRSRRTDSIYLDFIAVLVCPIVAGTNLFYLVFQLPTSVAEAIISNDPEDMQRVAAIEAPLKICEIYPVAALVLASCCGPFYGPGTKWKRLALVFWVGMLSWSTEEYLFTKATRKGVQIRDANLSRPYLFLATPVVGSVWAFLGVCVSIAIGFISFSVHLRFQRRRRRRDDASGQSSAIELDDIRRCEAQLSRETPQATPQHATVQQAALAEDMRKLARLVPHETIMMKMITVSTLLFLPSTFVISLVSLDIVGQTSEVVAQASSSAWASIQSIFIPRSNDMLASLDQALALGTGCIVVMHSCIRAWRSRQQE